MIEEKKPTKPELPKEQLRAVDFEGRNVVFAKGQQEYHELPAFVDDSDRSVPALFCFQVDEYQKRRIQNSGKIWLRILTFGHPLQPVAILVPAKIPGIPDEETEVTIQGRDEIKRSHADAIENNPDREAYETRHKTYLAEQIGREMMTAGLIQFEIQDHPEHKEKQRIIATVTIKKQPTEK